MNANLHIAMLQILLLSISPQRRSNLLKPTSARAQDCSQLHPFRV